jgi:hypothetical protein
MNADFTLAAALSAGESEKSVQSASISVLDNSPSSEMLSYQ